MIMGLMWILISSATKRGLSPALAPFCKCRSRRVHLRDQLERKIRPKCNSTSSGISVVPTGVQSFCFTAICPSIPAGLGRFAGVLLHSMAHYSVVHNSCAAVLLLVAFLALWYAMAMVKQIPMTLSSMLFFTNLRWD